jgi:hypothetical protein
MRGAPLNIRSVRSLAAAVAVAAAVALAARGCGPVSYWQGSKDLRIDLVVIDAETGAPVPGASIRLTPDTRPESSTTTGPDGVALLVHQFPTSGRAAWLENRGFVIFHAVDIEVESPGYVPLKTMLSDYLGAAQEIEKPDPSRFQVPILRGEVGPRAP